MRRVFANPREKILFGVLVILAGVGLYLMFGGMIAAGYCAIAAFLIGVLVNEYSAGGHNG